MDTRQITQIVIIATVAIWIIWDIVVATNRRRGDTESEVIRDYTIYPILPAALGTVCGHWTLLGHSLFEDWTGFWILLGIGALLVLWSALVVYEIRKNKRFNPDYKRSILRKAHGWVSKRAYIPFASGYLLGAFLWGQGQADEVIAWLA